MKINIRMIIHCPKYLKVVINKKNYFKVNKFNHKAYNYNMNKKIIQIIIIKIV